MGLIVHKGRAGEETSAVNYPTRVGPSTFHCGLNILETRPHTQLPPPLVLGGPHQFGRAKLPTSSFRSSVGAGEFAVGKSVAPPSMIRCLFKNPSFGLRILILFFGVSTPWFVRFVCVGRCALFFSFASGFLFGGGESPEATTYALESSRCSRKKMSLHSNIYVEQY